MRTCAVLVAALVAGPAWAHGGRPAIAEFAFAPQCVRVDDQVVLRWLEPDTPSVFGPSEVQLYVTRTSTRPLYQGERPRTPWTRIHSVLDSDPANAFTWRTATVAPGHYFVWSHMVEPPEENLEFAAFQAPFVLTVEREGALQGPTVMVTRPASLFPAFGSYDITYTACDPTGTARVRIEAAYDGAPDDYRLIADDLPAVRSGTVTWDTRSLQVGRWVVRAQVHDECGHVFESHARAYVEVRPPLDPVDAGPHDVPTAQPLDARTTGNPACETRPDSGLPDGGPVAIDGGPSADATVLVDASACPGDPSCEAGSGCGCTTGGDGGVIALGAVALYGLARRRRQRG